MPKVTLKRSEKMTITLRCQFKLDREQLAQIISHGLYWRLSFKSIQYTLDFNPHLGREGLMRFARAFIRNNGLRGVGWSVTAETRPRAIKKRAYELVDFHFPDLNRKVKTTRVHDRTEYSLSRRGR